MKHTITLKNVDLVFPILSIRAKSLRNVVANYSVGGRLLKDGKDVIHVRALSNINFSISDGDSLGIIGHNGSGKTTLLKVIAGIYEPTKGNISVDGKISSMIDLSLGLDPSLTGRENVVTLGRMRGFSTSFINDKINDIIEFSGLESYIDLPVKIYSSGMAARLVFSVVTLFEPDILVFDEWIGTGDADFMLKATKRLDDLVAQARSVVIATHSHSLVQSMCNKLLVLDGGKQIYFGDTKKWDFAENKEAQADV